MTVADHIAVSPVVIAGPASRGASDVEFTIVMPFRDASAAELRCTVDRIADALYAQGIAFEVVAVSGAVEEGFEAALADLPSTSLVVRSGLHDHGAAVEAGFGAARGRWVGIVEVGGEIHVEPYELVECLHRAREAEFALV
jgi:hypothetical protein